jgi:tripartite-type tricarboxylate transporter receptor subunit TctC
MFPFEQKRGHALAQIALVTLLALAATCGLAQSFPAKPLHMIVGFPSGGTTDVIGRLVAGKLSERLGQQVVVENRPGASGLIGADLVAKSSPDGYTLLMSSTTHATFTSLYQSVPFDPVKDFEPVALVGTTPYAMVVHPSLPVTSVGDLVRYAKARPGKLAYAGSTPGTVQHLGWELFKRATGVDMVYVPYKGTGALMPDLVSGRLQAAIDNVAVMTQYIKSGALRGIGTTGARRSPVLPELPTIAEAGVPGFQAVGWFGIFVAARTPEQIVRKLYADTAAVMKQEDTSQRMLELGAEPLAGSPDDLRGLLASETDLWGKVIRDVGLKVE